MAARGKSKPLSCGCSPALALRPRQAPVPARRAAQALSAGNTEPLHNAASKRTSHAKAEGGTPPLLFSIWARVACIHASPTTHVGPLVGTSVPNPLCTKPRSVQASVNIGGMQWIRQQALSSWRKGGDGEALTCGHVGPRWQVRLHREVPRAGELGGGDDRKNSYGQPQGSDLHKNQQEQRAEPAQLLQEYATASKQLSELSDSERGEILQSARLAGSARLPAFSPATVSALWRPLGRSHDGIARPAAPCPPRPAGQVRVRLRAAAGLALPAAACRRCFSYGLSCMVYGYIYFIENLW